MLNILQNEYGLFETIISLKNWEKYWNKALEIRLNVGGDAIIDEIHDIHEKGYNYLVENQDQILKVIIDSIFNEYKNFIRLYEDQENEDNCSIFEIREKSKLKFLIQPKGIYIMDVSKNNMPYIGYEFSCSWDEEHDLGLMLYKTSVVDIGEGDVAFLSWVAEEDLERNV